MPNTQLNDLSDDVISLVVKYGNLEDVVLKERVCKGFQRGVSTRLSKMKKIVTNSWFIQFDHCDDEIVLKLLRRMPNLIDGSQFGQWDRYMIRKLAKFNQSIVIWGISDDFVQRYPKDMPIVSYIRAVKEIDPSYTAERITCLFDGESDEVVKLYEEYPDLKLKFGVYYIDLEAYPIYERYHSFKLIIKPKDVVTVRSFNSSYVQHVDVSSSNGTTRDLTIFLNLKQLKITAKDQLNLKEWKLPSKLTHLTINSDKWNQIDDDALRMIIDDYPLINLSVEDPDDAPLSMVEMVLNSPNATIQNVKFNRITIVNDVLKLHVISSFVEACLIKRLLIRFKNVRTIKLTDVWNASFMSEEHFFSKVKYLNSLKDLCQEIEELQRRRSCNLLDLTY